MFRHAYIDSGPPTHVCTSIHRPVCVAHALPVRVLYICFDAVFSLLDIQEDGDMVLCSGQAGSLIHMCKSDRCARERERERVSKAESDGTWP